MYVLLFNNANLLSRFYAESVYSTMFMDHLNGDFKNDKFPNNSPSDWFLFKNFKMKLYEKEVQFK